MNIKLVDLFQNESELCVSNIERQEYEGDETFQVSLEAMNDGEVIGIQVEISPTRAGELGLVNEDGEIADLS